MREGGFSVAGLMSKLAPAQWWFWVLVVALWPLMLPLAAFLVVIFDYSSKNIDEI